VPPRCSISGVLRPGGRLLIDGPTGLSMILAAPGIAALIVTLLMRAHAPSDLLHNGCCVTGSPPKASPRCTNAENVKGLLYPPGAWLGAISTQFVHNPGKNATAARRP
jgi:hypothetical protein